ncbi:MAG: FtsW/RodA/SpoVE family cell cycle protein [Patescibacteria group bacterium]
MELKKSFRIFTNPKFDPSLFSAIFILSLLGLLNLAGIAGIDSLFFKKQLVFFAVGVFILFLNPLFDFRIFKNYSFPSFFFFGLSAFLLFFTLQAQPVRGVTAWLHFPFGVSFETSEVVKLAMILFLARYFSSRGHSNKGLTVLISGAYSFLMVFLVFLQPDLGSTVILFLIWLGGILLLGLTKKQVIIAVNLLVIISLITGVFILKPYQKLRITSFLSGFIEQGNLSYSVLQSKIAIGQGAFWGLGFGKGSQAKFGILPEATSDFALAALIEQFGFVSLILVLIFYFIILNRLIYIASRVQDNFSRFFIAMFLMYFFSHVVINAGMNLGLLPVTGLPLPFISYGGSYFISLMAGFSILENIRSRAF